MRRGHVDRQGPACRPIVRTFLASFGTNACGPRWSDLPQAARGKSGWPAAVAWQAIPLSGQDAPAVRASKKLKNDELLITGFASTRLRMELDRVPARKTLSFAPASDVVLDGFHSGHC